MRENVPELRVLSLPILALVVIACLALAWAKSAAASPPIVTQSFGFAGEVVEWTVPAGVTEITLEVGGAAGGGLSFVATPSVRAPGGVVTTKLTVTPGYRLAFAVGERGLIGLEGLESTFDGGPATFGGGGAGSMPGGGGTFVFGSESGSDVWVPLVIAGGGGGTESSNGEFIGGVGGFGYMSMAGGHALGTAPGQGGTATGPGSGATTGSGLPASYDGTDFNPGYGSDAPTGPLPPGQLAGGGGGGGYYGGGAGFDAGGGGGSGFIGVGLPVLSTSTRYGDGQVTLTYATPAGPQAALLFSASPKNKTLGANKQATVKAKVTNTGANAAQNVRVCLKVPKGKAKLIGKKCQTRVSLASGGTWTAKFKVSKTAKGKRAKVKLTALATNAGGKNGSVTLTLR